MFLRDDVTVHFRPEGTGNNTACGRSVHDPKTNEDLVVNTDWHSVNCGACERTEIFKKEKGLVYNEDVPHDATGRPL